MTTLPVEPMSPDEARARGKRNIAIALALLAFVALLFVLTLARIKDGAMPGGAF